MKIFQSAVFRALCSIVVGILLLQYGSLTIQWLTIVIGGIFFATGLISFIIYLSTKKRLNASESITDADGYHIQRPAPAFPIVGVGSMILGGILIFLPGSFVKGIVVVLALILVLGAVNQLVSLARATKFASVPVLFWIFPLVTFGIGGFILVRPGETIDLVMKLIGWCMIFYGAVEGLDAWKIYSMRKTFEKNRANAQAAAEARARMQSPEDITDAEVVDDSNSHQTGEKI